MVLFFAFHYSAVERGRLASAASTKYKQGVGSMQAIRLKHKGDDLNGKIILSFSLSPDLIEA